MKSPGRVSEFDTVQVKKPFQNLAEFYKEHTLIIHRNAILTEDDHKSSAKENAIFSYCMFSYISVAEMIPKQIRLLPHYAHKEYILHFKR
jgi:hypothetical protein